MNRIGFIGGSDAARILAGDWHQLYLEKIGAAEPEDLGDVFEVQLGKHTESFHLAWISRKHGLDLMFNQQREMRGLPHIRAGLDAWSPERRTWIETKHSNGFANKETIAATYLPQAAHYCNVCEVDHGWMSYIAGNAEPEMFKITPPIEYRNELLELELRFWWHVENREPPEIIPKEKLQRTAARAKDVRIDNMRTVEMTGNNEWANHAADYLLFEESAARFAEAKDGLKKLVEADVREAFGHGIRIKRNKVGSLLFSKGG